MSRDFSTISPSARWLLLLKAHTTLPFARQAAELMFGAEAVAAAEIDPLRLRHFELRTVSLDTALDDAGITNVLELASGFSFRGLARTAQLGVTYLDTDLPAVIEPKTELIAQLAPPERSGTLRVLALDALDRDAVREAVAAFPPGPIAIIHEGLLMYLTPAEKARLARWIHELLGERGGVWITADVYVRTARNPSPEAMKQFLVDHNVEQQKFADWAEAEAFFTGAGFRIERRYATTAAAWRPRETWVMRAPSGPNRG